MYSALLELVYFLLKIMRGSNADCFVFCGISRAAQFCMDNPKLIANLDPDALASSAATFKDFVQDRKDVCKTAICTMN